MKNYLNFMFVLIVFVIAVSGCKYSYGLAENEEKENRPTLKKTSSGTNDAKTSANKSLKNEISDEDETDGSSNSGGSESLAGKWVWSRTGSSTVSSSGGYLGGNGSRFTYEFSDDGAVKYTGAMSVMNGGCQMLVTSISEGQATLDGDRLTIDWEPGSTTREDSCNSSQNYTKETPAETQELTIRFQEKSGQQQFCLIEKEETCFSRID